MNRKIGHEGCVDDDIKAKIYLVRNCRISNIAVNQQVTKCNFDLDDSKDNHNLKCMFLKKAFFFIKSHIE